MKQSNAYLLREIVEQSLAHGLELLSDVELMEGQNNGGVNERVSQAGLQNAGIAIRNAMTTRIVLMVAREFSEPRDTYRNLHRAVDLLSDATVREIFAKNIKAMDDAQADFKRCKGDNRLNEIRHFRDKYTAHIGEPKGIPLPKYKDLFSFAMETVTCIDLIARATGTAVTKISDSNDAKDQAEAFWKPWQKGAHEISANPYQAIATYFARNRNMANETGQASIIDGDTLEIHGTRIGLWGIDAPESTQLCRGDDSLQYRCGAKAANDLDAFIAARPVKCIPVSLDRYGRTVASCSVDGVDLAQWLVSKGLALDWPKYSKGEYGEVQRDAEHAGRGIWAGSYVEPWLYRACLRSGGNPGTCSDDAGH